MNTDGQRIRMPRPLHGRTEFLAVTALALVLTGVVLAFTDLKTYDHPGFERAGDHMAYYRMAVGAPFSYTIPPYAWRISVPLMVKALPVDVQWGFLAVTFLALAGTAVALYYLARACGFARVLGVLGMLLFVSMGWTTRYNLSNFWLVDAAGFLVVTAAIYLIVARKDPAYAALLALGVTVKESALFVAPLYYTLRAEKLFDWRLAGRTVLYALPAVVVLIALRLGIPPTGRYHYTARLDEFIALRMEQFNRARLTNWTVRTFGLPALLLAVFAPRRNAALLLRFLPFLILVYLQILLARDTSRLLVLGFPAVVLASLTGARAIAGLARISPAWLLIVPASMLALTLPTHGYLPEVDVQLRLGLVLLAIVLARLWTVRRTSALGGHADDQRTESA